MFVLTEDHSDTIDDGAFETANATSDQTWLELPTDRHNQGSNLAMADGHAEHRRWKWPKKFSGQYDQPVSSKADLEDLRWLQHHLPANRIGKYPEPP